MNYGMFTSTLYIKKVVFSKAVLWHTRQLSLREDIMDRIRKEAIKKIVFIDELKGEKWTFRTEKVFSKMVLKKEGQESQYYFPIDLAKREKIPVATTQYRMIDPMTGEEYKPSNKPAIRVEPREKQISLL